jgi:hypothetical protein
MNSCIWCLIVILIIIIIIIALFFAFRGGGCYNSQYNGRNRYIGQYNDNFSSNATALNITSMTNIPRLFIDPSISGQSPCYDLYMLIYDLYLLYYNLAYGSGQYDQAFQAFENSTLTKIQSNKTAIIIVLNNPVVCATSTKAGLNYLESTKFYTDAYAWGQAQWAYDYSQGLVSSPTFEGFKSFAIERLNNLNSEQITQLYQCKENMVNLIYQTVFITSNTIYAANGQELLTLIPKINQFYANMLQCFNTYFTDNNIPDKYFHIIYENYLNINPNYANSDPHALPVKKPIITNTKTLIKPNK